MYVVLKNGQRLAEFADYGAACRVAREDAQHAKFNYYTVWSAEIVNREVRRQGDKPLYKVDGTEGGARYIIRNPPEAETA
jgi:hypothetical protein